VIAVARLRMRSTGRSTRPAVSQATTPTTTSAPAQIPAVAPAASVTLAATPPRGIAATTVSGPPGVRTLTAYTVALEPPISESLPIVTCCLLSPAGSRYMAGLPADDGSPVTTLPWASSTCTRGMLGPAGIGRGSGSH
jgi:hypothetical protein